MIPKNRIHLCRYLHAQTTPYPEAGKWLKRALIICLAGLITGVYLVSRPEKQKNPPEQPKQILGEQEQTKNIGFQIYEVKKGDTLFNLSQNFEVSWQTLAEINNLKEPYILKIGQKLKVPH
jgi:LysM repeat protein